MVAARPPGTAGAAPDARTAMGTGDLIRFCNNPVCERCDEHLRARETLRKAGRAVCPACHEELVVRPARPRPPLGPGRREPERRRA